MATVYRRTQRKPIPEGAEIVEHKGRRFAVWTDSAGRHRARVSPDGKAILVERPGYEIQYFDENGQRRKESVRCGDLDSAKQIAAEREKTAMFRRKGSASQLPVQLFVGAARILIASRREIVQIIVTQLQRLHRPGPRTFRIRGPAAHS